MESLKSTVSSIRDTSSDDCEDGNGIIPSWIIGERVRFPENQNIKMDMLHFKTGGSEPCCGGVTWVLLPAVLLQAALLPRASCASPHAHQLPSCMRMALLPSMTCPHLLGIASSGSCCSKGPEPRQGGVRVQGLSVLMTSSRKQWRRGRQKEVRVMSASDGSHQ